MVEVNFTTIVVLMTTRIEKDLKRIKMIFQKNKDG